MWTNIKVIFWTVVVGILVIAIITSGAVLGTMFALLLGFCFLVLLVVGIFKLIFEWLKEKTKKEENDGWPEW